MRLNRFCIHSFLNIKDEREQCSKPQMCFDDIFPGNPFIYRRQSSWSGDDPDRLNFGEPQAFFTAFLKKLENHPHVSDCVPIPGACLGWGRKPTTSRGTQWISITINKYINECNIYIHTYTYSDRGIGPPIMQYTIYNYNIQFAIYNIQYTIYMSLGVLGCVTTRSYRGMSFAHILSYCIISDLDNAWTGTCKCSLSHLPHDTSSHHGSYFQVHTHHQAETQRGADLGCSEGGG